MWLKKITLNDFRCFEHLKIDLHPRLTVLVGINGAGKTAILDAIAAGLAPVLGYLSSANQRLSSKGSGIKDTDLRLVTWEGKGGREKWGVSDFAQVIVETTDGLQWDTWRGSRKGSKPSARIGQASLAGYLSSVTDSLATTSPKLLPVFAYYGAQRGRIEIPGSLHKSKENYDHPTSALFEALDSQSNFKEMLKWFDREEADELRRGRDVSPGDSELSQPLEAVRLAIGLLLGNEFGNPHFSSGHKFVVEPTAGGAPLQVSQLSQGYQSMLALAMDFARRLALANGHLDAENEEDFEQLRPFLQTTDWISDDKDESPNPLEVLAMAAPAIMLVDEIDLHLHPSWQQRVVADLMRAFPATQFIVTTHSPQVLSTVRKECVRVLGKSVAGVMVAVPPLGNTYGQTSGDVLQGVMQVDPQPPIPQEPELRRLTEWVDQGRYDDDEAQALLERLTSVLGEHHSQLQRLRRSIHRQRILAQ